MKYVEAKAAAAVEPPERWNERAERLREREEFSLNAGGFERKVGTELWVKGGIYFGREAALQNCQRSG